MEILICDDIWFEVFSFFGVAILGLTIAPISHRFDCLVDKHLKTRKWSLGYINQRVIDFLRRIRRLFDCCAETTVYIGTRHDQIRSWHIVGQHIWPLIANNICGISLNLYTLDRLRREIAETILCDCKTLRWIHSVAKPNWNDAVEASSSEAVSEWLHASRRADGRRPPKVFKIRDYPSEMEQILARHKAVR
uniref:Uncharacterized protein n=1 Tax=Globodera rostochiensis TaxID=31243 RepID=A0A914I1V6_GLORO